jgi:hypothetical protein
MNDDEGARSPAPPTNDHRWYFFRPAALPRHFHRLICITFSINHFSPCFVFRSRFGCFDQPVVLSRLENLNADGQHMDC